MQPTGKDDLPGNDLKEDVSDYEVKAKDRDNGGTTAALAYARQPPTRRI